MPKCASPDCFREGINRCSICLREPYCSGECQKGDWKLHKLICKTLKRLSHQLQPYQDVVQIIEEIHVQKQKNRHLEIRVLKHLIAYAEHQFGDRVEGLVYRERENGDRINNWDIEIRILFPIYEVLISVYENDESLSVIARDDLKFPYYEKMLDLLRPWSASINLNSTSLRDSLTLDQINYTLMISSSTEFEIAFIYISRNHFDLAESHCQRALSHARLYEGKEEKKTDLLCHALRVYGVIQAKQGNYAAAVAFAEEAYNCVAVAYNPVHPKVQQAAGTLIECLSHKGDMYNAERFAQATLDSLKDPANKVDQQSEGVARGYYNLADVINRQNGDLVKAELLAKESLRIRTRIFHNNNPCVAMSAGLLASIFMSQGNLSNETKELYEHSLAICTKYEGPDGVNTAIASIKLGSFYYQLAETQRTAETRREHLYLSQSNYKEAVRIYTKAFGPDHPRTIQVSSGLSSVSSSLSET